MALISAYTIVIYERKPNHWRAAVIPTDRIGIADRGDQVRSIITQYRGIEYTVDQGVGQHMWTWTTSVVAGVMVMGKAHSGDRSREGYRPGAHRQKGAACPSRGERSKMTLPDTARSFIITSKVMEVKR
jgi:hypothetical protein